ncbi:MAG: hypothetical protein Tp136DCM211861_3 [Prokaryotic dsDNA virus sp.]|jgi:hypothetical protein|nr:MAG: hypothetical protein Tp136DCM211861_3 [Prokaryotic dsDNA virus sp.]|tara:strand:+ start:975 stop:1397 length:423 start_codon:yes stop_codon:yes gene_type:complete
MFTKQTGDFPTLKAKNVNLSPSDGIGKVRDRVQHNFYKEMAVIHPDHGCVARFRFYCGSSKVYCLAWLSGPDEYGSGHGSAGGYGYCKASAAMEVAIKLAGVDLSENIGGRGETAMRDAALAVGRMLTGKRKFYIHEAHS